MKKTTTKKVKNPKLYINTTSEKKLCTAIFPIVIAEKDLVLCLLVISRGFTSFLEDSARLADTRTYPFVPCVFFFFFVYAIVFF